MNLLDYLKEIKSLEALAKLEILQLELFNNTLWQILVAAVLAFLIFAVGEGLDWLLTQRLKSLDKKTLGNFYKSLLRCLESISHTFYSILGILIAVRTLDIPEKTSSLLASITIALIIIQVIISGKELIRYLVMKVSNVKEGDSANMTAVNGIMLIVNILLWTLGLLTIISNFGVNITTLATSLGVGGIAIAFALQNILEDLFSSFSIYFDKPFVIGDFIVTSNGHTGTVTKIGLKTTRIRALQGEEIVVSNKELTTSPIQNFKKLLERRVVFTIGTTYNTPNDKLKKVPDMIRKICEEDDLIRLDRANFFQFADSSLNFEVVIFIKDSNYNAYMSSREKMNLRIKEEFEKEGIEFAFPTRTLYIEKE